MKKKLAWIGFIARLVFYFPWFVIQFFLLCLIIALGKLTGRLFFIVIVSVEKRDDEPSSKDPEA